MITFDHDRGNVNPEEENVKMFIEEKQVALRNLEADLTRFGVVFWIQSVEHSGAFLMWSEVPKPLDDMIKLAVQ
jgi:hypothetical protein